MDFNPIYTIIPFSHPKSKILLLSIFHTNPAVSALSAAPTVPAATFLYFHDDRIIKRPAQPSRESPADAYIADTPKDRLKSSLSLLIHRYLKLPAQAGQLHPS